MQLPSHLIFAIHSSIGLSSKGHNMGMGRIFSGGASGPVEGSGGSFRSFLRNYLFNRRINNVGMDFKLVFCALFFTLQL